MVNYYFGSNCDGPTNIIKHIGCYTILTHNSDGQVESETRVNSPIVTCCKTYDNSTLYYCIRVV